MHRNLYKIDDVLLRAGGFAAALSVLIIAGLLSTVDRAGLTPAVTLGLLLAMACPIVLLVVGMHMRRKEKLLLELWRMIEARGQMSVDQLLSMTSLRRKQLGAAIRRINQFGNGLLLWDKRNHVVRDGRVKVHSLTHSQLCGSCGGSVNIEIRSSESHYACPYCGSGLDSELINPLLGELQQRQELARPAAQLASAKIDLGVFVVLLVFFWPAAIVYAIHKNNAWFQS